MELTEATWAEMLKQYHARWQKAEKLSENRLVIAPVSVAVSCYIRSRRNHDLIALHYNIDRVGKSLKGQVYGPLLHELTSCIPECPSHYEVNQATREAPELFVFAYERRQMPLAPLAEVFIEDQRDCPKRIFIDGRNGGKPTVTWKPTALTLLCTSSKKLRSQPMGPVGGDGTEPSEDQQRLIGVALLAGRSKDVLGILKTNGMDRGEKASLILKVCEIFTTVLEEPSSSGEDSASATVLLGKSVACITNSELMGTLFIQQMAGSLITEIVAMAGKAVAYMLTGLGFVKGALQLGSAALTAVAYHKAGKSFTITQGGTPAAALAAVRSLLWRLLGETTVDGSKTLAQTSLAMTGAGVAGSFVVLGVHLAEVVRRLLRNLREFYLARQLLELPGIWSDPIMFMHAIAAVPLLGAYFMVNAHAHEIGAFATQRLPDTALDGKAVYERFKAFRQPIIELKNLANDCQLAAPWGIQNLQGYSDVLATQNVMTRAGEALANLPKTLVSRAKGLEQPKSNLRHHPGLSSTPGPSPTQSFLGNNQENSIGQEGPSPRPQMAQPVFKGGGMFNRNE